MKTSIILVLILAGAGHVGGMQHRAPKWEDQPKELAELVTETRELGKMCDYGVKRVREPQFINRIVKCRERMNKYTREHSGSDINWVYWGTAFRDIYRIAGMQLAQGYLEAERTAREGLMLLAEAQSDDPLAIPHVKLDIVVWHVRNRVESNPAECARFWDETGAWVVSANIPELTSHWQFHRSSVEIRLLDNAGKLPEYQYETFAAGRVQIVAQYISDESVPMRQRSIALRCLTEYLTERGEPSKAVYLVEKLRNQAGATPDYWYARMLVSLFGEGDWEKATETLDALNRSMPRELVKPSDRRMQAKTLDLYYANLFLPDIELKRRLKAGNKVKTD